MSSIKRKERKVIIKGKLENIKNLITKYREITNRDEIKKFEVLLEEQFALMKHEFRRKLPYKYFSLQTTYDLIKKKKKFLDSRCVRCSSQENMTYYTRTRKMQSRSGSVAIRHSVTHQVFEFDFPVCSDCKTKYRPRSFTKLKVKYLGHTAPGRGKNYEAIPMVKPIDSKKWIRYDVWLKSL